MKNNKYIEASAPANSRPANVKLGDYVWRHWNTLRETSTVSKGVAEMAFIIACKRFNESEGSATRFLIEAVTEAAINDHTCDSSKAFRLSCIAAEIASASYQRGYRDGLDKGEERMAYTLMPEMND